MAGKVLSRKATGFQKDPNFFEKNEKKTSSSKKAQNMFKNTHLY